MARHRDFHNMDTEDFEEDGDYSSSFASSFNDEVSLSKSVEKEYMFHRGGSTPKLKHMIFGRTNSVSSVPEEDETDRGHEADSDDSSSQSSEGGGQNKRHSSGSSLVEALDEEEALKLAECLDYILDIVGDTLPEVQSRSFWYLCKVLPKKCKKLVTYLLHFFPPKKSAKKVKLFGQTKN